MVPELYPTTFEDRFQLTPNSITKSSSQGVLVASPANPTGISLQRSELKLLIETAQTKNMTFISDEIYHGLNFNGSDVSALEFNDEAIIINSFSKYFSMTGWRLGWMIVPLIYTRKLEKLTQNLFICPSHASQLLGLFTMKSSVDFNKKVDEYKVNRDMLMRNLPKLGFSDIVKPDGAFYIYADISNFNCTSTILVQKILKEAGVALTPGNDFDNARGHKTIRFSFARSSCEIKEGISRLTDWYEKHKKTLL